jgi:hypothetical protein
MCNYSLNSGAKVRNARIGDRLEIRSFGWVRGFALIRGARNTVTCLKRGTEIVFDRPPLFVGVLTWVECDNGERIQVTDRASCREARLVRAPRPHGGSHGLMQEKDVLAFADGQMIAVQCLQVGDRVTVLQLPARRRRRHVKQRVKARIEKRPEGATC